MYKQIMLYKCVTLSVESDKIIAAYAPNILVLKNICEIFTVQNYNFYSFSQPRVLIAPNVRIVKKNALNNIYS